MFKEALFALRATRQIIPVETEAGTAYVRSLTVAEKDEFDLSAEGGKKNVRANLLIACVCNEAGEPEFTEYDLATLNALPASAVEPLIDAAMKVNRFSAEDREAIRKNSQGQSGNSSSG